VTEPNVRVIPLGAIRTDGWFERVADSIGSFDLLCDILGEAFVAFSLITGARVTALTVDRRRPGDTLVDFEVGEGDDVQSQRLSLDDFRQRLANALCTLDPLGPAPTRETDTHGIQQHIGVRYLLLAPLFGYSLEELRVGEDGSSVLVHYDGREVVFELGDLQHMLRGYVMQEFYRADEAVSERRGGINLELVPKAQAAAQEGRHGEVVELLGNWMVPLSILLRTPDGQRLDGEHRTRLAHALGLLGSALSALGEGQEAQAALRLSVQYALDTKEAGKAYARVGQALLAEKRYSEAIAPLRRSANLGGAEDVVWPALALSFLETGRLLAALGATLEGERTLGSNPRMAAIRAHVFRRIPALAEWQALLEPTKLDPERPAE
jgi:hypothetical protein